MHCVEIIILINLFILSFYDIKYKQIPVAILCTGLVIDIGYSAYLLYGGEKVTSILLLIYPGLLLLILGLVFPQHIGLGDGLTLIMAMMSLPIANMYLEIKILACLLLAVSFAYIASAEKEKRIPFVPIITVSHIVTICGDIINASKNSF